MPSVETWLCKKSVFSDGVAVKLCWPMAYPARGILDNIWISNRAAGMRVGSLGAALSAWHPVIFEQARFLHRKRVKMLCMALILGQRFCNQSSGACLQQTGGLEYREYDWSIWICQHSKVNERGGLWKVIGWFKARMEVWSTGLGNRLNHCSPT